MPVPAKQQQVTFKVVPGSRIRRGDAQAIGEAFERIRKSGKALTAETVLDAATDPKSPLHRYITWDDADAAHQFRLEQARKLIRSVEVLVQDAKGKSEKLRAYYSVRDVEGARSYQPVEYVFTNADTSAQVMRDAKQQLESWMARYKKYAWAQTAVPQVLAALKALKVTTKKPRKK